MANVPPGSASSGDSAKAREELLRWILKNEAKRKEQQQRKLVAHLAGK